MKSLDQIEARTALVEGATGVAIDPGTGGIIITASGSYYLTGNLSVTSGNGITISADKVSLDLNGFTISSNSNPSSGNGIFTVNEQIAITNGRIAGNFDLEEMTGSGFENGIDAENSTSTWISKIAVFNCSGHGIRISKEFDHASHVESCHVTSVGASGIVATNVDNCVVVNSTTTGIHCVTATNCRARTSEGRAIWGTHISNCNASSENGAGIHAYHVFNSIGHSDYDTGIFATTASQCTGSSFEGTGIEALKLATHCQGRSLSIEPDIFGIKTQRAVGCFTEKLSATHKFDMP